MTDADKADKAAQRRIAKAASIGATKLDLDTPETHALTTLPFEIANLPALRTLGLSNTQITSLAPLAALTGLTWLCLGNTQITNLAPLAALTGLTGLSLENTQFTILAPLAALTGLTMLSLDDSAVLDLRPLRDLTNLVGDHSFIGLSFLNTPATRSDPRMAEIADSQDNANRARELFAYLETWVPPVELAPNPKPDPIFETP